MQMTPLKVFGCFVFVHVLKGESLPALLLWVFCREALLARGSEISCLADCHGGIVFGRFVAPLVPQNDTVHFKGPKVA